MKKGISASKGYAIGTVLIKRNISDLNIEKNINDVVEEKKRLYEAIKRSKEQLSQISENFKNDMDRLSELHIQLEFIGDPELIGAVESNIETNIVNAEKAIHEVVDLYLSIFSCMEDYDTKCIHIKAVADRIISNLVGNASEGNQILHHNTIVVAHDLKPSDAAQFDKKKVIGFLTNIGSKTSHVAIMARSLGIPAVVGLNNITRLVKNGDTIIVDGIEGNIIINPSMDIIKEYEEKRIEHEKEIADLKKLKNTKVIDKSGKYISIEGNIASKSDVDQLIENGADGVGLFRTEFLYMDRGSFPTEEEQFQVYKYVLEKMEGKPVTIRTLDIGADKKPNYIYLMEETNPFLGNRGIRFCLDRKDIFMTQLKALLRAAIYGNLRIMFPMVATVEEFLSAKEILYNCMEYLRVQQIPYNKDIKVGIMIEVPAAAICAEELAKHVDFFSIGTNDLIQYIFAADRMNEKVSHLYNPMHPAVLKLVKMTIEAAHKENIPCSMCGEMASDEKSSKVLLEYGLDSFSMTPSLILKAKKMIMES